MIQIKKSFSYLRMVGVAMILWGFILWVIMIPFFATLFKEEFFD
jgi:hypothetical protein